MIDENKKFSPLMGNKIRRYYDFKRQLVERETRKRIERVTADFPELIELDKKIAGARLNMLKSLTAEGIKAEGAKATLEALQDKREQFMQVNHIDPDYAQNRYNCEKCRDSGTHAQGYCGCINQAINTIQRSSGEYLPQQEATFESMNFDLFNDQLSSRWYGGKLSPRAAIQGICREAESYVASFAQKRSNMYLCGSVGTGKTYVLSAIGNGLLDLGHTVFYISAIELFDVLAQKRTLDKSFRPDPEKQHFIDDILDRIYWSEALLIDDLGTEMQDEDSNSAFLNLLDRRQRREQAVLIAGNLLPTDLGRRYDERVQSRISGGFVMRLFNGPDLRTTIRRSKIGE